MPSRVEDYEVLYTIGTGSYGRCQKIRRKSDGKVSAGPGPVPAPAEVSVARGEGPARRNRRPPVVGAGKPRRSPRGLRQTTGPGSFRRWEAASFLLYNVHFRFLLGFLSHFLPFSCFDVPMTFRWWQLTQSRATLRATSRTLVG